ncbi:MAG: hypothetical protein IJ729_04890 [Alloprevotella sp.]|nr:hypothetical protein [Alloprevotella sp.]
MAQLDDELLQDAADDARTVAYIQQHLPQELQGRFTEEQLYYILDTVVEYYAESGVLEAEPDEEGYVDIDIEEAAAYVAKQARRDGIGELDPADLAFVLEAEADCNLPQE